MVRALAITALALAAAAHWCAADSQGDRATALGLLQSRCAAQGIDAATRWASAGAAAALAATVAAAASRSCPSQARQAYRRCMREPRWL